MLTLRQGAVLGGLFAVAVGAPAACFYPSYTFDEAASGGAGGEPSGNTTTGGGATATTTNSTSGSGNAGASSSGGGGTGGMLGPEDCTNGVDDNGDGLPDCKDPKCGDFSCVGSIPEGWTGYFAVFDGVGDPDCGGDYPMQAFLGQSTFSAPPATCTQCSCPASGQSCVAPSVVKIADATCGGSVFCTADLTMGPTNGSCFAPTFLPSDATCGANGGPMCDMGTAPCDVSALSMPPTVTGGTCTTPTGGDPTLPPATFANTGRACGGVVTTGKGCNGAQACLPKPDPALYLPGVCISQTGDVPCQNVGAFTQKHTFFTGVGPDTRDCTDCTCGSPASGGTCTGTVTVYSDALCTTQIASFTAGSCTNIAGNPQASGRKFTVTAAPTGGTCPASGGQPTGSVAPTGATTYCCTP